MQGGVVTDRGPVEAAAVGTEAPGLWGGVECGAAVSWVVCGGQQPGCVGLAGAYLAGGGPGKGRGNARGRVERVGRSNSLPQRVPDQASAVWLALRAFGVAVALPAYSM